MAWCEIHGSCLFFNAENRDMPQTTACLKERYCKGNFAECALYMIATSIGREHVPHNLYPNDMLETLVFSLPDDDDNQGGTAMRIEVINTDGTLGSVRSSSLGELVKTEGIAAYLCSEGWVEVRRKRKKEPYHGVERRKSGLSSHMA